MLFRQFNILCIEDIINYQLSIINYQLSTINYQLFNYFVSLPINPFFQ
jgi:hypothetical protein